MEILKKIKDVVQGKAPASAKRSSKWPKVRAEHLKTNPKCAVCGGDKKIEVHHKQPFHTHPELELELNNLVTLCEALNKGLNCHLLIGHLGSYRNINKSVNKDVKDWAKKLAEKKKPEL